MAGQVIIKPGREKPLRLRHPWIFSGAIQKIDPLLQDGDIADIISSNGEFLARGYVNRQSQITVRVLTWEEREAIDETFWRARIARAIKARPLNETACRLINAESDGFPGLIVDRYGDWMVMQALTLGMEKFKNELTKILVDMIGGEGVYERSDVEVREKEGLEQMTGVLYGEDPPDEIEITEQGPGSRTVRFLVDVKRGQKTGFYLDQRENRLKVAAYCKNAEVLNVFSYTGGFTVYALMENARRVVSIDSSAEALALARQNVALNRLEVNEDNFVQEDAFIALRRFRAEGRKFDLIILDPPKFVHSLQQRERALRAYKDLNLVAMQILQSGGILVTFSCSGLVSPDLFQKIVFSASIDAGCDAQIIEKLSQSRDHPILLSFPEAEYLKGLICKVW